MYIALGSGFHWCAFPLLASQQEVGTRSSVSVLVGMALVGHELCCCLRVCTCDGRSTLLHWRFLELTSPYIWWIENGVTINGIPTFNGKISSGDLKPKPRRMLNIGGNCFSLTRDWGLVTYSIAIDEDAQLPTGFTQIKLQLFKTLCQMVIRILIAADNLPSLMFFSL